MDQLTRAHERYMNARDNMNKTPVPTHIMREYLDMYRAAKKVQPGLHDVVIVITRNASSEIMEMFRKSSKSVISEQNIQVEVEIRG